jgi:tetratricopeptide (TPR) repeat protein
MAVATSAGIISSNGGKLDAAAEFFETALAVAENSVQIEVDSGMVENCAKINIWQYEINLEQSDLFESQARAASAVRFAKIARDMAPYRISHLDIFVRAAIIQAESFVAFSRIDEAMESLKLAQASLLNMPASESSPEYESEIVRLQVRCFLAQDKLRAAENAFKSLLDLLKNDSLEDAYSDLADAQFRYGHFQMAIKTRQDCSDLRVSKLRRGSNEFLNEQISTMLFKADCYRLLESWDESMSQYQEALLIAKKLPLSGDKSIFELRSKIGKAFCSNQGVVVDVRDDLDELLEHLKMRSDMLTLRKDVSGLLVLTKWLDSIEDAKGIARYNSACCYGICTKLKLGWAGRGEFSINNQISPQGSLETNDPKKEYKSELLFRLNAAFNRGYITGRDARIDRDLSAYWNDSDFQQLVNSK